LSVKSTAIIACVSEVPRNDRPTVAVNLPSQPRYIPAVPLGVKSNVFFVVSMAENNARKQHGITYFMAHGQIVFHCGQFCFHSVDGLKLGATSSDILECVKLCYIKTVISERFSIGLSAAKCSLCFDYFR